MTTYIQYVRRDLKIGDIGETEDLAWAAPVGLGTDKRLTDDYAPKDGDAIYLVSALKGFNLPSLDARIIVNNRSPLYPRRVEALSQARRTVFAAGDGSCWLPMLDAMPLLAGLKGSRRCKWVSLLGKARDKNGKALSNLQRLHGLRTLRRLDDASALHLRSWVEEQLRAPVFISYRSVDGAQLAREMALFLAQKGVPVWFDEWSISIRLDEIAWANADSQLLVNIPKAMEGCAAVVRIDTPEYGKSEWTRRELEWAAGSTVVAVGAQTMLPEFLDRLARIRTPP